MTMGDDLQKVLSKDTDGLLTYEYIANHMGHCDDEMGELADNIIKVDHKGQITVSAALYLHSTDSEKYAPYVAKLIQASLEKDREHSYIADLLPGIWGEDYKEHVAEYNASSDLFRRIYKRVYAECI